MQNKPHQSCIIHLSEEDNNSSKKENRGKYILYHYTLYQTVIYYMVGAYPFFQAVKLATVFDVLAGAFV